MLFSNFRESRCLFSNYGLVWKYIIHKIPVPISSATCNGVRLHQISVPISCATCNGLKLHRISVPKSSVMDWLVWQLHQLSVLISGVTWTDHKKDIAFIQYFFFLQYFMSCFFWNFPDQEKILGIESNPFQFFWNFPDEEKILGKPNSSISTLILVTFEITWLP